MTRFTENAAFPHGRGSDRMLGESDFALFDCTGSHRGYYSDLTRRLSYTTYFTHRLGHGENFGRIAL
jgi:Xaa-Pro aminopeptidase